MEQNMRPQHKPNRNEQDEAAARLVEDILRKMNGGGLDADTLAASIAALKAALALSTHPDTRHSIETLLRDLIEQERDPDDDE